MHATHLIFPVPGSIQCDRATLTLPTRIVCPPDIPTWLRRRLAQAAGPLGIHVGRGKHPVGMALTLLADEQPGAYRLTLTATGAIQIAAADDAGIRHAIITLALLLEAAAAGANLTPLTIADAPAFAVRGITIDMAREFFPRPRYLRKIVNRMVDLKLNTLFLYLENHLHVPGLEDISPSGGMTMDEARSISTYAAERGVDVVPCTNVLSHMEGWFRLERYSDLADGVQRSHPVLTRPEAWDLVRQMLDAMLEAFPSPNINPGLDELLFCGTNPEAAEAIAAKGKATYFADFAVKVIDYLQAKGRRVWIWDDMVLGKNIDRPEGFNDDFRQALDRIPPDVVFCHWWYWENVGGKHDPVLTRVRDEGRPMAVAGSCRTYLYDCGHLQRALNNGSYIADVGKDLAAEAFITTHWESRYGCSFESGWPVLASGAAFAWSGTHEVGDLERHALSFVVTGETNAALTRIYQIYDQLELHILDDLHQPPREWRERLFLHGPQRLWQALHPVYTPAERDHIRTQLAVVSDLYKSLGTRNTFLNSTQLYPAQLLSAGMTILDAFDDAWRHYHAAALAQPHDLPTMHAELALTIGAISRAAEATQAFQKTTTRLHRTGHTPYDAHALAGHVKTLKALQGLIQKLAKTHTPLPRFDQLLGFPSAYQAPNLRRFQIQNGQGNPGTDPDPLPWSTRW